MALFLPRRLAACVLALPLAASASAPDPATIPASAFFRVPAFTGPVLSPDGTAVAFRVRGASGTIQLGIYDIATGKARTLAHYNNADVGAVSWLNPERLVFRVTNVRHTLSKANDDPGLAAINRDGSKAKQLSIILEDRPTFEFDPAYYTSLGGERGGRTLMDRRKILVNVVDRDDRQLGEMDAYTGGISIIHTPGDSKSWMLDDQGKLRAYISRTDDGESLMFRDAPGSPWRQIGPRVRDGALTPDPLSLIGKDFHVAAPYQGHFALFRVDQASAQLDPKPMLAAPGFDIFPYAVMADGKLAGFHYYIDAASSFWIDPRMKAMQADVDQLLTGSVNMLFPAWGTWSRHVLVMSMADTVPHTYSLYDSEKKTFRKLGTTLPDIDPAAMSRMDPVRYPARDGRSIPAWVVFPKDRPQKNLKMVILLEYSPTANTLGWEFQANAQFLASRGYLVLQPQARGKQRYGHSHALAGRRELGGKMLDDIEDAARWAIAQGWTSAGRICIVGSQFGGYSALMNLARAPSLYQCAAVTSPVTDLPGIVAGDWAATSEDAKLNLLALMPDPVRQADKLKAISPISVVQSIRQPVLMAYGESDSQVPAAHSRKFFERLSAHNRDAEVMVFDVDGKRSPYEENRIALWTRIEAFLAKHLK